MKNIYIKTDEEIISIVDKLIQSQSSDINLIIPSGAQIWQSSINLKLLKREADNLKRNVVLVVDGDLEAEIGKRTGFTVERTESVPTELAIDEDDGNDEETDTDESVEDSDMDDVVNDEEEFDEDMSEPDDNLESTPIVEISTAGHQEQPKRDDMINYLVREMEPKKPKDSQTVFASRRIVQEKRLADIVDQPRIKKNWFDFKFFKNKNFSQPKPAVCQINTVGDKSWHKMFAILFGASFVVIFLVCQLILPKTEITIFPRTEKEEFDLSVIGRKKITSVNESLNEIPLEEVEIIQTKSREYEATGEKEISEKAHGYITIFNEYSSSPQTLVATTRFESSSGKVFRIEDSVTIPGAEIVETKIVPSSVKVEIFADEPGESYNIGPDSFTIPGFMGTPKYSGFYAESDSDMTGGSVKTVKVVSAEDIENAKNELSGEIQDGTSDLLAGQVPESMIMVEGSSQETIEVISEAEENAEKDSFKIEVKVVASALFYQQKDLESLVDLNVLASVEQGKMVLPETRSIEIIGAEIDAKRGEVDFSLKVSEEVAWQVNTDEIRKEVVGLKEEEVRQYLTNQPGIQEAKVSFWPFWVSRVPKQEKRIEIQITSFSVQ